MMMRYPICLLLIFAGLFCSFGVAWAKDPTNLEPVPLALDVSDIEGDPAVTWGVLESGMRYAILPNPEPPGRLSLRLHVDAGSLMENDDQQGLAHFLEHMAFNGTTNFPPGSMVKYFQRLGMGFGNHTNAHTWFNETVYKLELPNTEAATLDDSFKLIRDYADGMLLPEEEINRERGIIMSEKRDRDSVGYRTFEEQVKFYLPNNRISNRLPIGTEEVITTAPRERFVEFYNDWYTPNRMVLIAVGDIEVDTVKEQLNKHFSSQKHRKKTPTPDYGGLTKRGLAAHYHYEKAAGETSVAILSMSDPSDEADSTSKRAKQLRLRLAITMMKERLQRLVKKDDAPMSSVSISASDFASQRIVMAASISAECKPENWQKSLVLIEQELRRGLEHGFTQSELEQAKKSQLKAYEVADQQAKTRLSNRLADQISRSVGSRKVFSHPSSDLAWAKPELEKITADDCKAALVKVFTGTNETLLTLSGNAVVEDAEQKLIATCKDSQNVAVTAPEEKAAIEFAYSDLPEAGKIAKRVEVDDLEITQLKFNNNVRVNLKVTDFAKGSVSVRARLGSGQVTIPSNKPGLKSFINGTFTPGGLEAHSTDDLRELFAGKSVRGSFSVDDDAFTYSGETNADDLRDLLLLMRAYITNPGYRSDAVNVFRKGLDYSYKQLETTPEGVSQAKVATFLHGGDQRFGYPERSVLESRTTEEAKAWLQPQLESAYLEVSVVGDFDIEKVIQQLAETVGSLPERDAEKPRHEELRKINFPVGETGSYEFESEIPKAMTNIYWKTVSMFDINRARRASLLATIFGDRLREKVREELGDAYSPFAHNFPGDTWEDLGYIMASVTVSPDKTGSVATVVEGIAEELAKGDSITQDELDRAKKPVIVSIEEIKRGNRYWIGSVLQASQEYPQRLEWSRSFIDDYKAVTLEEVNALAKEFLSNENRVLVTITPVSKKEQ